jgi:hypothetical protein
MADWVSANYQEPTVPGRAERSPTPSPDQARRSCSWSAATSCRATWRTGRPMPCSSTVGTSPRHLVRLRRRGVPAAGRTTPWAARRRCRTPRTGCGRPTSARSSSPTGSRRPGHWTTATWSPTTRGPSGSIRCVAIMARTRPKDQPRSSTRGRPSRTSPGSSSSPTSWPRPAGFGDLTAPTGSGQNCRCRAGDDSAHPPAP